MQAFPSYADFGELGKEHYFGMTLRQWYAGRAMAAMLSNPARYPDGGVFVDELVTEAFEWADAMLKEGDSEGKGV